MTAAVGTPRTVHVEHCMGTVFTIDIRDDGHWDDTVREVVAWLHTVDAVFSPYKEHSDLSRIRRGELAVADAHPDFLPVLDLCAQAQTATGGAFTAMRDGNLDTTGLVKGWAVERASALLRKHGSANHGVNGGGDTQLAGEAEPGRPWAVGILDPHDRTQVLTVVSGRDFAVATSGTAERGAHIVDPRTGRAVTAIASATVVGPSLTFADAYATSAVVLARDAVRWIDERPGYAALLVTAEGELRPSARWHHHVRTPWSQCDPTEGEPMSALTTRRAKTAALVGAGIAAGVIGAWTLSSNAQGTPTPSSPDATSGASAPATAPSVPAGRMGPMRPRGPIGDHDGDHRGAPGAPGGQNPDETVVTGSKASTLKAAALKQVPGSTVQKVETDSGDAAYEVHMTDADGKPVTVKFDKNLKFTAVEDGMGK